MNQEIKGERNRLVHELKALEAKVEELQNKYNTLYEAKTYQMIQGFDEYSETCCMYSLSEEQVKSAANQILEVKLKAAEKVIEVARSSMKDYYGKTFDCIKEAIAAYEGENK